MRIVRRGLGLLSVVALAGYAAIVVVAWLEQDAMVYAPPPGAPARDPSSVGLAYEELWLDVPDGERVHAWFVPAASGGPAARAVATTVLYCHGNGENMANRVGDLARFHDAGLASLIFDYRGYGHSEGRPGERATYEDADAALSFLTGARGIDPGAVVVWGHSLGGGVATWVASEREVGGLVLASTFASAVSLGAERHPWLPVRWLARHRYSSVDRLAEVTVPVVVAHARSDRGIPFSHGERLFAAAPEPKAFVELALPHGNGVERLADILEALGRGAERRSAQPSRAASRSKDSAPPSR